MCISSIWLEVDWCITVNPFAIVVKFMGQSIVEKFGGGEGEGDLQIMSV